MRDQSFISAAANAEILKPLMIEASSQNQGCWKINGYEAEDLRDNFLCTFVKKNVEWNLKAMEKKYEFL